VIFGENCAVGMEPFLRFIARFPSLAQQFRPAAQYCAHDIEFFGQIPI
jgi:hypothetical protein